MEPKPEGMPRAVDLEAVGKLVEALERDLEKVRAGSTDVQTLREEVETLRSTLSAPDAHEGRVEDSLHSVMVRLEAVAETIREDALKGSLYIAQIGRMLGM